MYTAIIPDPDGRGGGFPRTEIHGDTIPSLREAVLFHISDTGYTRRALGQLFSVYRCGALMGCIDYDGVWFVRDELVGTEHDVEVAA